VSGPVDARVDVFFRSPSAPRSRTCRSHRPP